MSVSLTKNWKKFIPEGYLDHKHFSNRLWLMLAIKGTTTVRECGPHAHCADRTPHSMFRKVRTNTISALEKTLFFLPKNPFFPRKVLFWNKTFFSEQTLLGLLGFFRVVTTSAIKLFRSTYMYCKIVVFIVQRFMQPLNFVNGCRRKKNFSFIAQNRVSRTIIFDVGVRVRVR